MIEDNRKEYIPVKQYPILKENYVIEPVANGFRLSPLGEHGYVSSTKQTYVFETVETLADFIKNSFDSIGGK